MLENKYLLSKGLMQLAISKSFQFCHVYRLTVWLRYLKLQLTLVSNFAGRGKKTQDSQLELKIRLSKLEIITRSQGMFKRISRTSVAYLILLTKIFMFSY